MRTDNSGWVERLSFCSVERVFSEARGLTRNAARWANVDSESGVTAIEYGLIAALVGVAIVAAATALGTQLSTLFTTIKTDITPAAG
jgi:pilus assembly protein Flp/PilA